MAYEPLQALIDLEQPSNLEHVRDRIAEILFKEQESQQEKAREAGKDPDTWALRVFTEASNCWGMFTASEEGETDAETIELRPIVNVWFDRAEYDRKRSDPTIRHQANATYHIDIYAAGVSGPSSKGHDSGDVLASLAAQRAYGYVRSILMAGPSANLQWPGIVGDHWPASFEVMARPSADIDKGQVEHVACGRLKLEVSFLEFAPEYEGQPLTELFVGVKRKETGELYFNAKTIGV